MQPGDWFYLPQYGPLSSLFLPEDKHIPEESLLRGITFQFPAVAPLATAYQSIQVTPAFNCWALAGIDSLMGALGFQVLLWHLTASGQRQFFTTSIASGLVLGNMDGLGSPLWLPETELFLAGDSIRCQVKNLSTTQSDNIWVALWGGDVTLS